MRTNAREVQPFRGEYVGNRPEATLDLVGPDKKTLRDKFVIGEPRDCPAGTADEMRRRGFVGIYQKTPCRTFRLPGTGLILRM